MMFDEADLYETEKEAIQEEPAVIHWELKMDTNENSDSTRETTRKNTVEKLSIAVKNEDINSLLKPESPSYKKEELSSTSKDSPKKEGTNHLKKDSTSITPVSAASGGYLARPSNIYAESQAEVFTSKPSAEEPVPATTNQSGEDPEMQLVVKDDIPAADLPLAHQAQPPLTTAIEDPAMLDEVEEQQRRAAERLQKLRNLSFNINNADPNNEFENVPAYIRRNMELYGNSYSAVENFYSNYEVKKDDNNNTQISTINTFLDGKKPD
jgi:cell division protein FtsZ